MGNVITQIKTALRQSNRKQLKLVTYLSVSQLIGWGTLYYAFSLFVDPMHAAFGWSKPEINMALTIGFVSWAIAAPLAGAALVRLGGRIVMSMGSILGVAALLIWAYMSHIYLLYAAWAIMGFAMASALYKPAFYVLTMEYPDQYKRVITWLTLAGGFASTIFIPLVEMSINSIGWHYSLLVMVGCNLCIALPIHYWLLPKQRSKNRKEKKNQKLLDLNLFREKSFKAQTFWGLNVWFIISNSLTTGITFLFIPLLSEVGTEQSTIIFCFSMIGPMQVAGRFIIMWFDENLHAIKTGFIVTMMAPIGIAFAVIWPKSLTALLIFTVFFGTSKGIMTIIKGTVVAEQMDLSVYARTNGWLSLFSMLAKAATPTAMAALWALTGDPILTLSSLGFLGILAPIGIELVRRD